MPVVSRGHLTRRRLLAAVPAVVLSSACDGENAPSGLPPGAVPSRSAAPSTSAASSPDEGLRVTAAGDEADLLAAYDATLARHPGLRTSLSPLRAEHAEHWAALAPAGAPPLATASPTATPPPEKSADAVRALIDLERRAVRARGDGCLVATLSLAPLLGSIAASEAAHAAVLAR